MSDTGPNWFGQPTATVVERQGEINLKPNKFLWPRGKIVLLRQGYKRTPRYLYAS